MNEIVYDIFKGYTEINGFIFVSITNPPNIHDAIVIRNPENANADYPQVGLSKKTLEEHIELVKHKEIEKSRIYTENLGFLNQCDSLKHLEIIPSNETGFEFDFSALYGLPEILSLNCRNQYGNKEQFVSDIDYSKINGLISLNVNVNKGTLNINKIETLKSLYVVNFKGKNCDLTDLFCSKQLDSLAMVQCGIQSLNGIDTSKNMQCLYLHYNCKLSDISELRKIKGTLRELRIENCSKIEDFSVLGELENVESLDLLGSNTLPNLDFLKTMKKLKTFLFNMNVEDGDLSACMNLPCVFLEKDHKHYNLKSEELPKCKTTINYQNIEKWRMIG